MFRELRGLEVQSGLTDLAIRIIEESLEPLEKLDAEELLNHSWDINGFRHRMDELDGELAEVNRSIRVLQEDIRKYMKFVQEEE